MGRKLYVGNLPYSITEQSIRESFGKCGKVDSVCVDHRSRHRSEQGLWLRRNVDRCRGSDRNPTDERCSLDGRQIKVNEAKPKAPGGGGGGGGRGGTAAVVVVVAAVAIVVRFPAAAR